MTISYNLQSSVPFDDFFPVPDRCHATRKLVALHSKLLVLQGKMWSLKLFSSPWQDNPRVSFLLISKMEVERQIRTGNAHRLARLALEWPALTARELPCCTSTVETRSPSATWHDTVLHPRRRDGHLHKCWQSHVIGNTELIAKTSERSDVLSAHAADFETKLKTFRGGGGGGHWQRWPPPPPSVYAPVVFIFDQFSVHRNIVCMYTPDEQWSETLTDKTIMCGVF